MRIVIGGDVSVKDCEPAFAAGRGEELFGNVADVFRAADHVLVNLECAVTEKDTPIKKIGPSLKAPLNTVKTLGEVGVTACVLSNNHIFDYGKPGALDTIHTLEANGLAHTGFGMDEADSRRDLILTDGRIRVAVIAVCEHEYSYALPNRMGARPYDPYDTNDDIAEAKRTADYVIVIYHGGKEECRYPSPRLLKACRSMVKHGADVVLCQHSHCIGCYEEYMGGHILYGQGNFHFVCKEYEDPSDGGEMWNTGLLAVIDIDHAASLSLRLIPSVADGGGIRLAEDEEADNLLGELANRSLSLKDGTWYEHFRAFALSQSRYRIVPPEQYEDLAHYFDCEAHTDACREIYQTYNRTNELE